MPLTKGKSALIDADMAALVGKWSWCFAGNGDGYALRKGMSMHRFIFEIKHGFLPPEVDHINGDTLDNRASNLREASRQDNCKNQALRSDNTSGYKGVYWSKHHKKYRAKVQVGKKSRHLGFFLTAQEASSAYQKAAEEAFSEFKRSPENE